MGKKTISVPDDDSHLRMGVKALKTIGEALASAPSPGMGPQSVKGAGMMPDMGQSSIKPPSVPSPIPGALPNMPASKPLPSKRYNQKKEVKKPAWRSRSTVGEKVAPMKGNGPKVDKEQQKQINSIIKKK